MAPKIECFLRTGINIMDWSHGTHIAAIGVNFIMTGIKSELPGLAERPDIRPCGQ